jgi:hypothetical protein
MRTPRAALADARACWLHSRYSLPLCPIPRSCRDFAFTAEHLVFDLCRVRMLHGWICDQQDVTAAAVIGRCTYDELIEKVIDCNALLPDDEAAAGAPAAAAPSEGERERLLREGLIAQEFLNSTASQLTYLGLVELHNEMGDNELAALFRNNHFSVLYKREGELFVLVTDLGYLHEAAVWERLDALDGDTVLCGADFCAVKESERQRDHEVSAVLGDVTMHERAALGARALEPQPSQPLPQPPQGDLLSAAFLAEHLGSASAQPALPIAQAVPLTRRADADAEPARQSHADADGDLAMAMRLQAELNAEERAETLAAQQPPPAARGGPQARSQSSAPIGASPMAMASPRDAPQRQHASSTAAPRPKAHDRPKSTCQLM